MIWVIDASVAVRWLLEEEGHPNADAVLRKVVYEPERFAVPELFAFEVFCIIQRLHPDGTTAYTTAIAPLLHSGIFRQPMTEELARAAGPYVQSGLTGYDACYAALATTLEGKWLTFDQNAHQCIRHCNISCLIEHDLPPAWQT